MPTHRVPDLIVPDFFSLAIMDWANAHNVPLVIYSAVALGHIGGYGDTWALPDTLLGSSVAEHQHVRCSAIVHGWPLHTLLKTATHPD
jgi:hypothetical protein